ncbi:MAG: DUF3298 domain-containing protein [bacterium]
MKKSLVLLILFLMFFGIGSYLYATDSVELTERTLEIKIPTFSQLKMNSALKNINETLYTESFNLLKNNSVDVETDFSDWDVIDYYSQATKTFENDRLLSFKMDQYLYTYRSAHGSHLYLGFVFDLETGEKMKLNEIFNVKEAFYSTINGIMNETIEEKEIPIFDFTDFQGLDDSAEVFLEEDSLVIVFQEYAYTPYVYGPLTFKIPLAKLSSFFNSKYF